MGLETACCCNDTRTVQLNAASSEMRDWPSQHDNIIARSRKSYMKRCLSSQRQNSLICAWSLRYKKKENNFVVSNLSANPQASAFPSLYEFLHHHSITDQLCLASLLLCRWSSQDASETGCDISCLLPWTRGIVNALLTPVPCGACCRACDRCRLERRAILLRARRYRSSRSAPSYSEADSAWSKSRAGSWATVQQPSSGSSAGRTRLMRPACRNFGSIPPWIFHIWTL